MEKTPLNFLKSFLLKNWQILLILAIGAVARLYRIDEFMTFLGDEGRDAIYVRRLLVNFDLILVGPGTSIGNMYLGPFYYYMMAPALLLANYSPAGPAVMVALLGIATIWLVWFVTKEWFGETAAKVASFFFAISPVVITYSRSSWNPNIMPFFALLCIYSVWKVWAKKDWKWLTMVGLTFGIAIQSHYLALLLIIPIFIFWVLAMLESLANGVKKPIVYTLALATIFIGLVSPLIIFDFRHGWRNFTAMKQFFVVRQATVSAKPWKSIPKLPEIANKVVVSVVAGKEKSGSMVTFALFSGLVLLLLFKKEKYSHEKFTGLMVLLVWFVGSVIGLGSYRQEIYDHYYGFIFPAPMMLLGLLVSDALKVAHARKMKWIVAIIGVFILWVFYLNVKNLPIKGNPNRQLQRSIAVAQRINKLSGGEKFNFAVIAERNYEGAYQYFLEKDNAPFVIIDAQRPDTVAEQLFVVCEYPVEKCQPTSNPKAEVANFGWSKIEDKWEESGVLIFKLVHNRPN